MPSLHSVISVYVELIIRLGVGRLALLILTWGQCEGLSIGIGTKKQTPTSFFSRPNSIINAELGRQEARKNIIMRKIFSFAVYTLFAVFTTLSLSACGDNDNDGVNPTTGNSMDNGHEYVDLGLPSGLKWATCNIGANKPEGYGIYFAWGETKVKSVYNWETYAWGAEHDQLTKYCTNASYGKNGFTDNKNTLDLENDAAHVNWGGRWRMPTKADFEELLANTSFQWVDNYNGTSVSGTRFNAANGNHIFLPAAGWHTDDIHLGIYMEDDEGQYWSCSLDADSPDCAYIIYFDFIRGIHIEDWIFNELRNYGCTVRPVRP